MANDLVDAALERIDIRADTTIIEEGTLSPALRDGQFDGSAALWRDADRERTLFYSDPYLENRMVLVARGGTAVSAQNLAQLAGRRVALVSSFSYGDATAVTDVTFVLTQNSEDSLHKLLDGEVDYALLDELVVEYLVDNYPTEVQARLVFGARPLIVRSLHFALRRDHPDAESIVRRFNGVLRGMVADHSYHRLLHLHWIEADVDGDGATEFVPRNDQVGPEPPTRGYELFAVNRPEPEPPSRRRFYIEGRVYQGWDNVPDRYKATRQGETTTTAAGEQVFAFNWFVGETFRRVDISVSSLPFPTSFVDRERPVDRIVVWGVNLYDARQLLTYALARTRAPTGDVSARDTALAMRTLYREDGYFLANVTTGLDTGTGDLELRANEGRIGAAKIEGLRDKLSSQVAKYLEHVSGERPVRQAEFERALMLSSDLAGVDILSEFAVKDQSRAASLRLVGSEYRQAGSITFDTVPLLPGTSYRGYLLQQFNSLVAGGDLLRVMAFGTLDSDYAKSAIATAYYRAPVGSHGTYLEGRAGNAFMRRDFREFNLSSDVHGIDGAFGVGHPFKRNLNQYLYGIGEYETLKASAQFGTAVPQRSQSHSGRFTVVFGHTAGNGALTQMSATVTGGVSPDEVRDDGTTTRAPFAHLRVGFGTVFPVRERMLQRIEVFAQTLSTDLPVVEHIFLGFGPYLRGYPPVEFNGERGVKGTAELSYTLVASASGRYEVVPSGFIDFGYAASGKVVAPYRVESQGLASTGLAVRIKIPGGIAAGAWLAVPLADGPGTRAGEAKAGVQLTKGW